MHEAVVKAIACHLKGWPKDQVVSISATIRKVRKSLPSLGFTDSQLESLIANAAVRNGLVLDFDRSTQR